MTESRNYWKWKCNATEWIYLWGKKSSIKDLLNFTDRMLEDLVRLENGEFEVDIYCDKGSRSHGLVRMHRNRARQGRPCKYA